MKFSNHIQLASSIFVFSSLVASTATVTETKSRICYDYIIPVNATNVALKAGYKPFTSNYDVADFFGVLAGRNGGGSLNLWIGRETKSEIYKISATVCSPKAVNKRKRTILLATHGIGFDKRYWDSDIQPEKYSFVDFAVKQGYTVFFYDRLGTGKSQKVPGYSTPQALTQLAILRSLTILLSSGKYTGPLSSQTPAKIAHIGHSYGSLLSNALIATTPSLSSGAVLTGVAYAGYMGLLLPTFAFRIANQQSPGRWPGRDMQYLVGVDRFADVGVFFKGGTYDEEVLCYTEKIKQPVASAELVSVGVEEVFPLKATNFTGPVMVLSGENDLAFCESNCTGILDNEGKTKGIFFPKAKDFQTVIHPKCGHGINFSYNATGAYGVMLNYLRKNGL